MVLGGGRSGLRSRHADMSRDEAWQWLEVVSVLAGDSGQGWFGTILWFDAFRAFLEWIGRRIGCNIWTDFPLGKVYGTNVANGASIGISRFM